MTALDEMIAKHKARITQLEAFKASLDDPELAAIAREVLGIAPRVATPPKPQGVAGTTTEPPVAGTVAESGSAMRAIRHFFETRDNRPATFTEAAEECGIAESTVKKLVYSKFPQAFKKLGIEPGDKFGRFQLATIHNK